MSTSKALVSTSFSLLLVRHLLLLVRHLLLLVRHLLLLVRHLLLLAWHLWSSWCFLSSGLVTLRALLTLLWHLETLSAQLSTRSPSGLGWTKCPIRVKQLGNVTWKRVPISICMFVCAVFCKVGRFIGVWDALDAVLPALFDLFLWSCAWQADKAQVNLQLLLARQWSVQNDPSSVTWWYMMHFLLYTREVLWTYWCQFVASVGGASGGRHGD